MSTTYDLSPRKKDISFPFALKSIPTHEFMKKKGVDKPADPSAYVVDVICDPKKPLKVGDILCGFPYSSNMKVYNVIAVNSSRPAKGNWEQYQINPVWMQIAVQA